MVCIDVNSAILEFVFELPFRYADLVNLNPRLRAPNAYSFPNAPAWGPAGSPGGNNVAPDAANKAYTSHCSKRDPVSHYLSCVCHFNKKKLYSSVGLRRIGLITGCSNAKISLLRRQVGRFRRRY